MIRNFRTIYMILLQMVNIYKQMVNVYQKKKN
uniref:Uncharacterized protein n=1 Tax=virus sp. ctBM815 TaxID=2825806 RepID=A0A8S5RK79_9VIRU|nr:MAG TPA: hypothetical protein [virus sp. ctBM815]